ncbi:glycoside hydrolase superfamily [Venturia nashicola]|uniref:alpha-galactosidase n=1 Tax=Venturia nashicola TaxID=86259 RepID=A0A4Z1PSY2_9PEZI|nr:glycoside hydrolase superfamily [Venturia nashicola]TLD39181.1 glycoside hydrolase superfamily [Venturia nashicola]
MSSSAFYQPLAVEKSEITGCRSPPPSSSWWARSSTATKLMVVGAAIASSMLVMGAAINMCLHDAPLSKHLVVRSHRPHGRTSTPTTSSAAAAATSDDSEYDSGDYAASTAVDPETTIASIISSSTSAIPTKQAAASSTSSTKQAAASSTAAASTAAAVPASSGTLWQPPVKASWQIILNHVLDVNALSTSVAPDVDVFDIDLFDNPKETFDALKRLGKKSICYFSAGSFEPGRPDSGDFVASDKGSGLDGWPGEYWLNLKSANVRSIMTKRIELAASKGCDAIDPDNVDAYGNSNGLGMTKSDSIDFIKFLSATAASHGMSTGLKNGGDIAESVLDHVHFAVNEQCAQYNECDVFNCMINAGKPVFHIEYPDEVGDLSRETLCAAGTMGPSFSTVLKKLELDGYVQTCSSGLLGYVATTAISS